MQVVGGSNPLAPTNLLLNNQQVIYETKNFVLKILISGKRTGKHLKNPPGRTVAGWFVNVEMNTDL